MAGSSNIVGSTLENLREIIAGVADQSRVGVCRDTCHLFAAGHDLRSAAAFADVMDRFDAVVGRRFLRALHLNDSKGPFASRKDLHCNIGLGDFGLEAFRLVMSYARLRSLPLVLEMPSGDDPSVWAHDAALLHGLVGLYGVSDVVRCVKQQKEAKQAREGKMTAGGRRKMKDEHVEGGGAGESDGGAVIEMQYAVSFPGFFFFFALPACSSHPPGYQDVDSGLHREVCRGGTRIPDQARATGCQQQLCMFVCLF